MSPQHGDTVEGGGTASAGEGGPEEGGEAAVVVEQVQLQGDRLRELLATQSTAVEGEEVGGTVEGGEVGPLLLLLLLWFGLRRGEVGGGGGRLPLPTAPHTALPHGT